MDECQCCIVIFFFFLRERERDNYNILHCRVLLLIILNIYSNVVFVITTMSDIDECTNLELCNFYDLRYHCVNVPGRYYCDPVLDHKSRNKIIIIGMSFFPL